MKNINRKTQYVVICNAFKKLETLLEAEGYHETAVIIIHLMYMWLRDYNSKQ